MTKSCALQACLPIKEVKIMNNYKHNDYISERIVNYLCFSLVGQQRVRLTFVHTIAI